MKNPILVYKNQNVGTHYTGTALKLYIRLQYRIIASEALI